jgi:hypothetical protein
MAVVSDEVMAKLREEMKAEFQRELNAQVKAQVMKVQREFQAANKKKTADDAHPEMILTHLGQVPKGIEDHLPVRPLLLTSFVGGVFVP